MTVTATNLPAVGEVAPDFTLKSTADEDVALVFGISVDSRESSSLPPNAWIERHL